MHCVVKSRPLPMVAIQTSNLPDVLALAKFSLVISWPQQTDPSSKFICTFKCHNHCKYYGTFGCTFNIFSSLWLHGCGFFNITNRHDCKSHNQNAKSSQTITEGRMPRLCNLILLKMCDYQLTSVREI